jgi:hypothetical protein
MELVLRTSLNAPVQSSVLATKIKPALKALVLLLCLNALRASLVPTLLLSGAPMDLVSLR